jgi:carbonic anhydrase
MLDRFPAPTPRLSRRWAIAAGGSLLFAGRALAAGHEAPAGVTPDAALKRLLEGNARYVAGKAIHPDADLARRATLANGQQPFATVLACADSRVAPELIFDEGLGDIFDVRVAGNVVDDAVMGSIEYAVVHLSCPLVMVLGHESCGAVTATLAALDGKGSAEDRETKIGALAAAIMPAAKSAPAGPQRLDAAVVANARGQAVRLLNESPAVKSHVAAGKLKVVAARYDLHNGKVTLLR